MLEGLVDIAVWSFEAGYIKPEPPIYRLAADRLEVPPSAVLMAGLQAVHLVRLGGRGDIGTLERLLDSLP